MRFRLRSMPPPPLFPGLACAAILAAPVLASDWIEPRNNDLDAGEFAAFAQVPVGFGELESITGRLDGGVVGPGFGAPPGVPDFQDLFLIHIVSPSAFTARTVPFGFEDIDTELFLFSADGFGLLNNDNENAASGFSRLIPIASDGTFHLTVPGLYVIGVAAAGNIPTSAGGAIFGLGTPTEVSGPDGPGGGLAHTGWITNEIVGRYRIELTGVAYVPLPARARACWPSCWPGRGAGAAEPVDQRSSSSRRRASRVKRWSSP